MDLTGSSEAQTVLDAGQALASPTEVEPGRVYAFVAGGQVHLIDQTDAARPDGPSRPQGTVAVYDADAFVAYVDKHDDGVEVWSDPVTQRLVAVLDAHSESSARHEGHRVELVLRKTPEWEAWEKVDGNLMGQAEFAEFIEDNAADVREPTAAAMLELATTFQAHTGVEFKQSTVLGSGQRGLTYVETTTARAGQSGQIEIPASILLGLRPFYGTDRYQVTARFRYRITHGTLRLGVKLDAPHKVAENAFGNLVKEVGEDERMVDRPVWLGTPAVDRPPAGRARRS